MYHLKLLLIFLTIIPAVNSSLAQPQFSRLGLENKNITSLGFYDANLAVGTNGHGVYFMNVDTDTGWICLGLDSAEVLSVYPHKSGSLGWALGAGLNPDNNYPHYVYCSYMANPFEPKDYGMTDTLAAMIHQLDGFPDPSICGETYAAAGTALFRRNYNDSVWTPIYRATDEGYVATVKTHLTYPGVVLTGGAEGIAGRLLLKSLDSGDTWQWLAPPGYVTDIDFAGDSAQTIFVVAEDVYLSRDGGQTWDKIYQMNGAWIERIIYDSSSSLIWIGGRDAHINSNFLLQYSKDWGANWNVLPALVPNPIIDMVLSDDGWLFIATPDSGIIKLNTNPIAAFSKSEDINPQVFELKQNYPNPFNSITNIEFIIDKADFVQLAIYNILGEKIEQLAAKSFAPGHYTFSWDATNFASGIYYYKLEIGKSSDLHLAQSKKLLLLK